MTLADSQNRWHALVDETFPQPVSFGSGEAAARLEGEAAELGASRVMLIASKREMDTADTLTRNLRVLFRCNDVVMHVPVEVTARAREAAQHTTSTRSSATAAVPRYLMPWWSSARRARTSTGKVDPAGLAGHGS